MEDQTAISRLKQGDLSGLETLVKRYQVQAVHSAYLILSDRSLAEDVVQSAFLKIVDRIHQFDESRRFAPWFFRIVVNDALKRARKQHRTFSLDETQDQVTVQLAKQLRDPQISPDEWVIQKETQTIILKAIQSLPPGQRAAIVMRFYLDMSMNEMASQTGRPLSTVKWWLRDARKRLRSLLDSPGAGRR